LSARDLVAKGRHFLRLSAECSDLKAAKALRIFAEYLIDKAVTLESTGPISIAHISGGSVEAGSQY
jgi:hypothetical protein